MRNMLIVLPFITLIPLALFFVEYKLAKANSKYAIILPVVVLCFAIIIPPTIITSIIMFVIYFVMKHLEKERQEKLSEIDKMNIQDLE